MRFTDGNTSDGEVRQAAQALASQQTLTRKEKTMKTRFIEILEVADGYNGHTCIGGLVWDYESHSLVFVHTAGFFSVSQTYVDQNRNR